MKTDLELFKELYLKFGINLKQYHNEKDIVLLFGNSSYDKDIIGNEKFDGYNGFYTKVDFDLKGNFIKQSFYE